MTIKEMRVASDMTQAQFACYFKTPKRTIEVWECERRECNEYLLNLIEY